MQGDLTVIESHIVSPMGERVHVSYCCVPRPSLDFSPWRKLEVRSQFNIGELSIKPSLLEKVQMCKVNGAPTHGQIQPLQKEEIKAKIPYLKRRKRSLIYGLSLPLFTFCNQASGSAELNVRYLIYYDREELKKSNVV